MVRSPDVGGHGTTVLVDPGRQVGVADVRCVVCGSGTEAIATADPARLFHRCLECGLIGRVDASAAQDLLESFWGMSDRFLEHYVSGEGWRRQVARQNLAWIERHTTTSPARLLDIGCAAGYLLDEASARGWEPTGVDIAAPLVACAKQIAPRARVYHGDVLTLELPVRHFAAITVFDAFGYLDPIRTLRRFRELLKPGGRVFLTTVLPNHLMQTNPHLLSFDLYYDERALRHLFSSNGFRLVECDARAKDLNTARFLSPRWLRLALPGLNRNAIKMQYVVAELVDD